MTNDQSTRPRRKGEERRPKGEREQIVVWICRCQRESEPCGKSAPHRKMTQGYIILVRASTTRLDSSNKIFAPPPRLLIHHGAGSKQKPGSNSLETSTRQDLGSETAGLDGKARRVGFMRGEVKPQQERGLQHLSASAFGSSEQQFCRFFWGGGIDSPETKSLTPLCAAHKKQKKGRLLRTWLVLLHCVCTS